MCWKFPFLKQTSNIEWKYILGLGLYLIFCFKQIWLDTNTIAMDDLMSTIHSEWYTESQRYSLLNQYGLLQRSCSQLTNYRSNKCVSPHTYLPLFLFLPNRPSLMTTTSCRSLENCRWKWKKVEKKHIHGIANRPSDWIILKCIKVI